MSLRQSLARALTTRADPSDPEAVDPELVARLSPWIDRACRAWYRLEVEGLEHVPDGAALLVGNHNSGTTMFEAFGVFARLYRERPDDLCHGLAHDVIVDMPGVGRLLTRVGALRARAESADAAFSIGRKVVVFPGGNREAFRPWSQRHQVDFSNRTGFVRLALRHQVPIVPMVFIGGHDTLMILSRGERIARWTGLRRALRTDAWPIMLALPWGIAIGPWVHLPLPVQCTTRFLPPMPPPAGPEGADDPAVCAAWRDAIQSAMQAALTDLAQSRKARRST
jgi:1-acyl-sn-glycerol-3-phosphate acyltransferase